ncbi:hypothetical protein [Ornithinibacillus bavariensis]|uniref:Uncharacterized protein n=1 Tax=Ornithinibacillus bavariensis TaxID=545502 RepID=A0A919XAX5_9BACI|nr:hypothetical protein [Ornithinibacillus bavariensis]GIO27720.1 hypothetical protein J43TS3_23310 [Ornithinibacillus bavariensis]
MKVLFSPYRSSDVILYQFDNDKIIVHYNGEEDLFDFTEYADGELDSIETILPDSPIRSAKRVNGELYVQLLYFYGSNATHAEKFPEWKEHSELKVGVYHG